MAAKVVPVMAIDRQEAHMLAEAVADVSQHYSVLMDPKTLAWVNLSGVLVAIYGTRLAAVFASHGPKKVEKPAPVPEFFDPATLAPIPGVFANGTGGFSSAPPAPSTH